MRVMSLTTMSLLTLLGLCGCATQRTVAVADCPKPAPLPAFSHVQGPDPEVFPQCLQALLAQTSAQGLPSSCLPLQSWLSSVKSSASAP